MLDNHVRVYGDICNRLDNIRVYGDISQHAIDDYVRVYGDISQHAR